MNKSHNVVLLLAFALPFLCVSTSLILAPTSPSLNSSLNVAKFKIDGNRTSPTPNTSRPQSCGPCGVGGPNVDVYYWPQSNANTSCLNIIGPTPRPPLAGATSSNGLTYWGSTNTNEPHEVITTMVLTSINGITFKMPLVDPYPWTDTATPTLPATGWVLQDPIGKRAYPTTKPILVEPRAPFNDSQGSLPGNEVFVTGNRTLTGSTVVYNGHTLTSPSIYVDFYSLSATDSCGPVGGGSNGVVTSTLIAFAPGELSTFAAPLNEWLHGMQPGLESSIVPYNFADLPCPPYKTMTDQWYKPEPGEPYRPIIAFPSKVLKVDPLWNTCSPWFFTGLDPPTMLHPATAMVPLATPAAVADPFTIEAKPKPTFDDLPSKTAKPPAQLTQPPRNTAMSIPDNGDPDRTHGESDTQAPADPESLNGSHSLNSPEKSGGPIPGGTNNSPEDPAVNPIANQEQAAGVTIGASSKYPSQDGPSNQNKKPELDPATEGADGNSEIGSNSDPVSAVFPHSSDDTEQPHPIATVGSEPIVAIPQTASSENSNPSDPMTKNDKTQSDIDEGDDTEHTEHPIPYANLQIHGSQLDHAAASPGYTSDHPKVTFPPSISTIERHVIQAASNPNAILVDGETLTLGHGSKVVSGTTVALHRNGDLILGTSTVMNLLSNPLSIPANALTLSNHISAAGNQQPATSMPSPTGTPQVYRIGTTEITAGEPPLTISGTKIQAFDNGALVVGSSTYYATPTPTPPDDMKEAGIDNNNTSSRTQPDLVAQNAANSSSGNNNNNNSADNVAPGATSGQVLLNASAVGVVPYQGSATKATLSWSLLCGVLVMGSV